MKLFKLFNWVIIFYFIGIIILMLTGHIVFGHGSGDLFYLLLIILVLVIQLTLTGVAYSRQNQRGWKFSFLIVGSIFLLVAIYLTFKFTIGRGPEFLWNGKVFA